MGAPRCEPDCECGGAAVVTIYTQIDDGPIYGVASASGVSKDELHQNLAVVLRTIANTYDPDPAFEEIASRYNEDEASA